MRPRLVFFLALAALVGGCATTHMVQPQDVLGRFVMTKGGFNEWLVLELNTGGSYRLEHALLACVIGDDGVLPIYYGREEGVWRIERGSVALEPRARSKDFMDDAVFIAVHAQRLAFRRDAGKRVLVHATAPEFLVLTESTDYPFPFHRREEIAKADTPESKADASR